MLIDKRVEFPLRHNGIGEIEAVELNLPWTVIAKALLCAAVVFLEEIDELVVKRTVRHKLEGADGVGDTLKVVALSMGKVVHGIAVPLCAGAVVRCLNDAIDDGIAEMHVRICHVELCAKHH